MASNDKHYTVYPAPETVAELGQRTPELNAALDRYALLGRLLRAQETVQQAVWSLVRVMLEQSGQ